MPLAKRLNAGHGYIRSLSWIEAREEQDRPRTRVRAAIRREAYRVDRRRKEGGVWAQCPHDRQNIWRDAQHRSSAAQYRRKRRAIEWRPEPLPHITPMTVQDNW